MALPLCAEPDQAVRARGLWEEDLVMDAETAIRFTLVLAVVAIVIGLVIGGGWAIARWARRTGRRPAVWVIGAYAAASIALAMVRGMMR